MIKHENNEKRATKYAENLVNLVLEKGEKINCFEPWGGKWINKKTKGGYDIGFFLPDYYKQVIWTIPLKGNPTDMVDTLMNILRFFKFKNEG